MKVDGRCHCGAIAYVAEVDPVRVGLCHCHDCQALTGSAFRVTVTAPADGFRLLRGEPRFYLKAGDSGAKRRHAFCGDCGAPVYASDPHAPTHYPLRVGALRQRAELGLPARQIWTARRLPWVCDIAAVPEGR